MIDSRIPVMTYHAVGNISSPLWTPVEVFEAQLAAFAECGYRTISLADVLARLHHYEPLPEKVFVITFDDGYGCVYTDALPRLQHYNFTASVFLISDYCECTNQWVGQPSSVPVASLLTWSQAEKLVSAGWEIGAHTRSHCSLPTVPLKAAIEEIASSQQSIQAHLGQSVQVFAYPYGASNPAITQIVQQHFNGAVGTNLGLVQSNADPYLLSRIDAHYLLPIWIPHINSLPFQRYLDFRQLLRSLRRTFQPDWQLQRNQKRLN
jgi:peptidoglycan/xylan/chitin deacetylase (PgdA/CDA1 family)